MMLATAALPSPGDIEKVLCNIIMIDIVEMGPEALEDAVTKQVCTLAEPFKVPDCKAKVEKAWEMVVNMCVKPSEDMMLTTASLPSAGGIEKILCKFAGNKVVEDTVTKQVCTLAEQHLKIPDCQANAEKAWDMVANMCPKPSEDMMLATAALPSPGDIEKVLCNIIMIDIVEMGPKALEDLVTQQVCTLAEPFKVPDCKAKVEKAWEMVVNMCVKPSEDMMLTTASLPSAGGIEKILCKFAGNKVVEDTVTKQVCTLAEQHLKIPDCQANAEKAWDVVAN